ncbi:MAG: 2-oxoglutarate synthase, partial [Candidatus Thiodiazotropha sp. (ex Lucinoma annulata)]|nr:2-oxoglutarate synthase [Candidatus Thiodiazotropha sp. (ex Lucinoma annulata)]
GMYTADGLEHNARGTPSSMAVDHREQLNKRLHKLEDFEYGDDWAEIEGEGAQCIITWGSSAGVVKEVARQFRQQGNEIRTIAIRLLAPLQRHALSQALEGMKKILVVEQNHGGQLFQYLRAQDVLPMTASSLAQPGPLPLRPGRILRVLDE